MSNIEKLAHEINIMAGQNKRKVMETVDKLIRLIRIGDVLKGS